MRNVNIKGQYGFLELDDREDAADAIRDVNGKSFNGGRLVCLSDPACQLFQTFIKVGFVLSMRMPTLGMIMEEMETDRAEVTETEIPEEGKDEHTCPWYSEKECLSVKSIVEPPFQGCMYIICGKEKA